VLWQELKAVTVFGTNQLKITPVESQHLFDIQAFRCGSNQSVNKIQMRISVLAKNLGRP
jgi:hypothetical protein